jgi:hypothetical protein
MTTHSLRPSTADVVGSTPFVFDDETLLRVAAEQRPEYVGAEPFPHTVLDGLVRDDVLRRVIAEFPPGDAPVWKRYDDYGNTVKLALSRQSLMGPWTSHLIMVLNSGPFLEFLEELTGIQGLVPDPQLVGGGLHLVERGGFLNIHADFNRHPHTDLERRLNLLLYLNPDWDVSYGGQLELWGRDMRECVRRIEPVENRCVVFSTTSHSYHGHPQPLTCPRHSARRSLALYYYSKTRPRTERSRPHSTRYRAGDGGAPGRERSAVRRAIGRALRASGLR